MDNIVTYNETPRFKVDISTNTKANITEDLRTISLSKTILDWEYNVSLSNPIKVDSFIRITVKFSQNLLNDLSELINTVIYKRENSMLETFLIEFTEYEFGNIEAGQSKLFYFSSISITTSKEEDEDIIQIEFSNR